MKLNLTKLGAALILALAFNLGYRTPAEDWVVYEGKEGPGKGKHIVFVAGDEEYRSEEGMPMLAKILAERHGFKCTVLFSLNPKDGTIDPNNQTNIVGLEKLAAADMMVLFTRFRELPDEKMKYFADCEFRQTDAGPPHRHARARLLKKQEQCLREIQLPKQRMAGRICQQVLGDT